MVSSRLVAVLAAGSAMLGVAAGTATAATAADALSAVQLHGYMQNRIYAASGSNVQFRMERVAISATAALPEDAKAYAEVNYHPWAPSSGLYLESGFYQRPMGCNQLWVGKGRRTTFAITPTYSNRKTANYGITNEAFTQDRIAGIQFTGDKGVLSYGASVQSAYRLGIRPIGEIPGDTARNAAHTVSHLAFRDPGSSGTAPAAASNKLAANARIGAKWGTCLRADMSYYYGRLNNDDLAQLTTAGTPTTPTSLLRPVNPLLPATTVIPALLPVGTTSKTQTVWGPDFVYKHPSGMLLQGEFFKGQVSTLEYNAWDALIGYEPANPMGWRFYARYGQQNMYTAPTINPLTWDVRQVMLSAVQPISKTVWLQYEAEINSEGSNPTGSVSNNLYFVELFTGF